MDTHTYRAALPARTRLRHDPAYQAFVLLRAVFVLAPVVFGVDKVVNLLADWERYLAPAINDLALRDFGLLVAALALARLAAASFPRDTPLADGGTAA